MTRLIFDKKQAKVTFSRSHNVRVVRSSALPLQQHPLLSKVFGVLLNEAPNS